MHVYTIHLPPPYAASRDRLPVAVREGFNLWAFLFTGLWAFTRRMWLEGVVLLLVGMALGFLLERTGLPEGAASVVSIAYMYLVGCHANDWRRGALARRGWREDGVVVAEDADAALRRHGDFSSRGLSGFSNRAGVSDRAGFSGDGSRA